MGAVVYSPWSVTTLRKQRGKLVGMGVHVCAKNSFAVGNVIDMVLMSSVSVTVEYARHIVDYEVVRTSCWAARVYLHAWIYIYIYILYMPRTEFRQLPFSFREGSEAALLGHVTEHRGGPAEQGRASRGLRQSTGERARALGEPQGALHRAHLQKPVRAQGSPLGLDYSYLALVRVLRSPSRPTRYAWTRLVQR